MEAGVLIRQNDAMTQYRSETPDLWSVGGWDRLAASIVNTNLPFMYSTSAEGVILKPSALQPDGKSNDWLLCSYPRDGNSMTQLCEKPGTGHAVPFRYTNDNLKGMLELHESRFRHEHSDICLWKAGGEQPDDRSNCRYNEVVMSASYYKRKIPNVIEAFFYPINGPVKKREGDPARARRAHEAFLERFGKTAMEVPLLTFDVEKARNGRAPFGVAGFCSTCGRQG